MMNHVPARPMRAFTLIELLVVIALVAIVLTLAIPSFRDFMLVQRLKGVSAQLTTDLQFARSEAVTRNIYSRIVFRSSSTMTCYTIFIHKPGAATSVRCDCQAGAGSACSNSNSVELRTVQVPGSLGVTVTSPNGDDSGLAFSPIDGSLQTLPFDKSPLPSTGFQLDAAIDSARILRTKLGPSGRPTVCGVSANLGVTAC